jgi:hypothetical protein
VMAIRPPVGATIAAHDKQIPDFEGGDSAYLNHRRQIRPKRRLVLGREAI